MYFLTAGYQINIVYKYKVSKMRTDDMARLMVFLAATLITLGLARAIMVTNVLISIYM